jgi:hypothetical protein
MAVTDLLAVVEVFVLLITFKAERVALAPPKADNIGLQGQVALAVTIGHYLTIMVLSVKSSKQLPGPSLDKQPFQISVEEVEEVEAVVL